MFAVKAVSSLNLCPSSTRKPTFSLILKTQLCSGLPTQSMDINLVPHIQSLICTGSWSPLQLSHACSFQFPQSWDWNVPEIYSSGWAPTTCWPDLPGLKSWVSPVSEFSVSHYDNMSFSVWPQIPTACLASICHCASQWQVWPSQGYCSGHCVPL